MELLGPIHLKSRPIRFRSRQSTTSSAGGFVIPRCFCHCNMISSNIVDPATCFITCDSGIEGNKNRGKHEGLSTFALGSFIPLSSFTVTRDNPGPSHGSTAGDHCQREVWTVCAVKDMGSKSHSVVPRTHSLSRSPNSSSRSVTWSLTRSLASKPTIS